ncbi:S8 family serine peptidase [Pontibacter sp. E15-1]|uniref:S8 family serine peptidase n=1 Tax=Pontibacter sp. E15-1 TaxID=2919918 RepID=UPI001F4F7985|nr:S8 family serine peptidase [Pontibacter sp. E15-1]MCJ8165415.1 S8 family serine peptidase [Pontibacter sp. E15-1]
MRRLSLWLVALGLVSAAPAMAQRTITPIRANTEVLQRIAVSAEKDYKANRARALELARQHGWVITQTMKDGTFISLQGLDAKGLPIYYITYNNSRAAATTHTDQLWAGGALGLSLSGASPAVASKLAMWDGGKVRVTHQELAGRVQQKDGATELNEHATHVAGTLIATGINPLAKGMAFEANLQAYDFDNDESEMAKAAANLLVSNHSYGSIVGWRYNDEREGTDEDPYWEWWGDTDISKTEDYRFGYYDGQSAAWDKIAYNAPYYLIVKSAGNNRGERGPEVGKPYFQRNSNGKFTLIKARPANLSSNDGYDVISTAGNAKNILAVGAISPLADGYTRAEDVRVSSFSSYGPTDDGRIKPDVVGNGVAVLSSAADSDRDYSILSGTSMSAPNVAGSLLLLQEHYANLHSGNVMRAATLKALAIHTADEAGTTKGPDYVYGWGLLNAAGAAKMLTNADGTHLLQEKSLAQGQVQTLEVRASGAGPLRVTISWTDPEGSVVEVANALNNRVARLVNDLDVRVTGGGTTYRPWTLDPATPDVAAKPGDNIRDNVEQVLVENAVPGETYSITVNHKGTLSKGPQAYSLLVSGAGGKAVCASAPTSETGAKIARFAIGTKAVEGAAGCTTYRNLTATVFTLEPNQSQTLTVTTGSCAADAATIAKVFADWNGDGDFEDAGETVATSGVLNGVATFSSVINTPGETVIGDKVRLRVVLQETTDAARVSACGSYERGETQDYLVQFSQPGKDIAVSAVIPVGATLCATSSQPVSVTLRNLGAVAQKNIPVTISVRENGVEIAQLSGTYTATLEPFAKGELVLEGDFATEPGKTYELVTLSNLPGDAVAANNRWQRTFTVQGEAAPPTEVTATRCGNAPTLTLTHQGAGTVFWYNSPTAEQPIAAGNLQRIPVSLVPGKLYAAYNDFLGTVGPKTRQFATGGGYNQFSPDVLVTAQAPLVLESARLYIGNGGKITFTAFDKDGSPVSSRTLEVTPTRTPAAEGPQPTDPADQGAIYYLGLVLPEAGEYRIAVSYENGATIYRNNEGVQGYPFEIPNVFAITGNTATTTPQQYYYYFYDLKVRGLGCESARVEVPLIAGAPLEQPVITRNGQALVSSEANGSHQWFLDGNPIPGATGREFTPAASGDYTVQVSRNGCVSEVSEAISFDFKSSERGVSASLLVFPNPSANGKFSLTLETTDREDISMQVVDLLGKVVYTGATKQFNGQYRTDIDLSQHSSGMYILHVQHGGTSETRKLLIRR